MQWFEGNVLILSLKHLLTIADIRSLIASLRDKLTKEQSNRTGRNRTSATVNRYLALLSHACTIANKEWQWMAVNPVVQMFPVN